MDERTCYEVLFDHSNKIYFSGQKIIGKVLIHNFVPKCLRGIYATFLGRCRVKFQRENNWIPDQNFEILSQRINLSEKLTNNEHYFQLLKGTHEYHFEYDLPKNIDSSFYGKFGFIHYDCTIYLESNIFRYDNMFKQPFLVFRSDVAGPITKALQQLSITEEQEICSCCCLLQHPLKITGKFSSANYPVDSIVQLNVDILNRSSVKLRKLIIKLYQSVEYVNLKNHQDRRYERFGIKKIELKGKNLSDQSRKIEIRIPFTQPSIVNRYINIEYYLKISAIVPGSCNDDMEIILPIGILSGSSSTFKSGLKRTPYSFSAFRDSVKRNPSKSLPKDKLIGRTNSNETLARDDSLHRKFIPVPLQPTGIIPYPDDKH